MDAPKDTVVSMGTCWGLWGSRRAYTLREKPQGQPAGGPGSGAKAGGGGGEEEEDGEEQQQQQQEEVVLKGLLGLPQEETELEVSTYIDRRVARL